MQNNDEEKCCDSVKYGKSCVPYLIIQDHTYIIGIKQIVVEEINVLGGLLHFQYISDELRQKINEKLLKLVDDL